MRPESERLVYLLISVSRRARNCQVLLRVGVYSYPAATSLFNAPLHSKTSATGENVDPALSPRLAYWLANQRAGYVYNEWVAVAGRIVMKQGLLGIAEMLV